MLVRSTGFTTRSKTEVSTRNPFVRLLSALWYGADGVRKILHLVLLLVVFLVFFGAMSATPPMIPDNAALFIQPRGALVEQLQGDPYDRAMEELLDDGRPQTLVQDIVDALHYAKHDDRIEVVYFELSNVRSAGLSKLQRIAVAIEDFKTSGKPVIASADFMSQRGYYLAAHADEVYLHPNGVLLLRGYGRFRSYYKDAIDSLRVDWNVFRVGTHKSYVEPFTRMNMSDEDRESTIRLIDQLWMSYQADVVAARGLDDGAIDDFAENLVDYVRATNGDIAIAARNHGLVYELLTRNELRELMIAYVGEDPDHADMFNATGMQEYLTVMRMLDAGTSDTDNVAIIVAAGDIMFGSQAPGKIGADSTAALLRRARNNESVKAVVMHVDSPGGSAFAAEVIAHEIEALREAGKPVVASMSSVAASGGYRISIAADRVFASPSTITGSIGVFGMFPTYQRTFDAIGIATDGVGSTPWSGQFRPDREMSEGTKQLFQLFVEDTYDDFISSVAESRGLAKREVDLIGQGQVWTGADALANGLIDELGTFEDAIAAAAELAGLEEGEYGLLPIEAELSATEQFVVDLLGVAVRAGLDLSSWVRQPTMIEGIARDIGEKTDLLLRFNDPRGVYSHCLCDFDL